MHRAAIKMQASGVTRGGVGGGGGKECPQDFRPGNLWRLFGKNEGRKKGKKMENVKGNEEKWTGRRKMREENEEK